VDIIEETLTQVRVGKLTYRIGIAALPGADPATSSNRVAVDVGATDPEGVPIAEGRIEVDSGAASALGTVLAGALRAFAGSAGRRRRPADGPARRGAPWTEELDAELERSWLAGKGVEEIAALFERSPGGIRARLPRVGCDPEEPGAYLPVPPSRREAGSGGGET
jgi:hypothetical protein